MKKSTIVTVIAILMVITVCLYFISGTYARYADSRSGNATTSIAKWAVSITDGTDPLDNDFTLPFTVEENQNVVAGKIAPSTTAKATIELDLTGTEVAVDFSATSITGAASSGATTTIQLPTDGGTAKAFDSTNGKIEIEITLTWTNDDTFNTSDTTVGVTAGTLELPVELTLQQHI